MNRTAYKNHYIKNNYDRINLLVPKGVKEKIKEVSNEIDISLNEYIYMLICEDIATGKSKLKSKKQGFNEEQRLMLEKWQVPKKYYEMIEDMSYSKEDGYFVYLKEGYINDITGNGNIQCEKTSELRGIINKSHRK